MDAEQPQPQPQPQKHLTPQELAERFRGRVTPKTLANWRWLKIGPPYIKAGARRVLYPLAGVEAWEREQTVDTLT